MSLKIYDAYIINIPSPNIYNLQQIFDNLRTEITNATMASIQKKIVKKCLYYYYFKQLHGNMLVEQMLQQTAITSTADVEIHKIWETVKTDKYAELYDLIRQRMLNKIKNSNNTDVKLQIVPLKDKILAMFFGNNKMEHFVSDHSAYFDYHYQNQTDKPKKVLEQMGFSEMDILNLNCGIWLIKDQTPYTYNSIIKWWRLKKRWFQSLFVQKEEITIKPVIEKMIEKEMPRKIDGENLTREFYLEGFSAEIPVIQNSYLLFDLLTRRLDGSGNASHNSMGNVLKWRNICKNHDLSVMGDVLWLKGLMAYLNPQGVSFNIYISTGADRNKQIYAEVIKDCENLEEKQEVLKEIFQKDVKEFIYQHPGFFRTGFLDPLFISGFLDMDRYYKENSCDAAKYLSNMEYPFQLAFLQKFCEDRNWQFTSEEAEFLKSAVKDSWMVSLAYANKSTDTCFQRFSPEEKKLLLGLVCELCVRIPYICRLDLLMAGLIANTETRFILGEKTAQEWYRILKQRDFGYQDSLDRDFLSAEAYKKIQKQKEEQKEKERQDREAREVEIRKASLEVKLQGLTIKEAAKVFAGKVPSFVFLDRERTLALLEVYKEHFEDKEIFTDKKVICKLMKFFLDCYENNYITKPVLMNKLGLLKED